MSSPHPIKPGMVFGRATPPPLPALPPLPTVPRFSTRPVHPFSVTCAFDRQRGQFVVQAGARAGACAVLAAAVLALGAFAYVRSTLFGGGPKSAAAAVMPALTASATPTVTRTVTPAKTKTSGKAEPSQKAAAPPAKSAKAAKPAKGDQSAVSATPAPTQKASPSKSAAAHRKAETRKPGLNYLVVKNLKTRASAEKARELLLRKGVATTIERNLPGQAAEAKYSLVCMTGFRPESERAQLDKQVKRLKAMKLDPKPVTWRG